jgi:hypothetical protein
MLQEQLAEGLQVGFQGGQTLLELLPAPGFGVGLPSRLPKQQFLVQQMQVFVNFHPTGPYHRGQFRQCGRNLA